MKHSILKRYPIGNPHRVWKQDNFVLSTFAAHAENMRDTLENCRDAGFNTVELGWASHEQAEEALRLCEELGLPVIYQDFSLFGGMQGRHLEHKLTKEELKSITDHVKPYKSCIGYYVWDEPYVADQLAEARRQSDMFQSADPARLPFVVAIPSYNDKYRWQNGEFARYLSDYVTVVDPPVLSLDYYPIGLPGYTDEKQTDDSLMWCDLGLMRKLGRERELPVWFYYQAVNLHRYSRFTFPMVRMSMYAAAMYGCKGLQQFTAVGSVIDDTGARGPFFEEQKRIHAEFAKLGNTLMALDSRFVFHGEELLPGCDYMNGLSDGITESTVLAAVPGYRISAGELCDAYGNTYLMIVNRDYEKEQTASLSFRAPMRVYEVSKATGRQEVLAENVTEYALPLGMGDGRLLRVQPAEEEACTLEYRLEK